MASEESAAKEGDCVGSSPQPVPREHTGGEPSRTVPHEGRSGGTTLPRRQEESS